MKRFLCWFFLHYSDNKLNIDRVPYFVHTCVRCGVRYFWDRAGDQSEWEDK